MQQYLILLLDDTSTSYCHYTNERLVRNLMSLDTLKAGILYAMKENLMIQFVLPDYLLPTAYWTTMNEIDHHLIVPGNKAFYDILPQDAFFHAPEVVVFEDIADYKRYKFEKNQCAVIRVSKQCLFEQSEEMLSRVCYVQHLSIVITDVETFTDEDFNVYKRILEMWSDTIEGLYVEGKSPQLNLLTDRMMLNKMNNCGAGDTNITLAPDGKFYICPAFYQSEEASKTILGDTYSIGSLKDGLDIKNGQLHKLEHAPLCRICDAYQCRRCAWLNRKTTLEVNTPSHEQCVVAHLERNASRELLSKIRKHGEFLPGNEIKEIDYLDPFDVREQW